jgi:hypothetical protein
MACANLSLQSRAIAALEIAVQDQVEGDGAMGLLLRFALAAMATTGAASAAPCEKPPQPVADYLETQPGWVLLTRADLSADHRPMWDKDHKGLCPGLAAVVLDAGKQTSYALALLKHDKGGTLEQLVLLKAGAAKPMVLEAPSPSASAVVWRAPPGKYSDPETGKDVAIATDSIMYEMYESAAEQFYFVNRKLHKLQAGD